MWKLFEVKGEEFEKFEEIFDLHWGPGNPQPTFDVGAVAALFQGEVYTPSNCRVKQHKKEIDTNDGGGGISDKAVLGAANSGSTTANGKRRRGRKDEPDITEVEEPLPAVRSRNTSLHSSPKKEDDDMVVSGPAIKCKAAVKASPGKAPASNVADQDSGLSRRKRGRPRKYFHDEEVSPTPQPSPHPGSKGSKASSAVTTPKAVVKDEDSEKATITPRKPGPGSKARGGEKEYEVVVGRWEGRRYRLTASPQSIHQASLLKRLLAATFVAVPELDLLLIASQFEVPGAGKKRSRVGEDEDDMLWGGTKRLTIRTGAKRL